MPGNHPRVFYNMARKANSKGYWKNKKYNDDWVLTKCRECNSSYILRTPREVGNKEARQKLLSLPGASSRIIVDDELQECKDFFFATSLDFKTLYKELREMFNIDAGAPSRVRKKGRTVYQYTLDGKFVAEYPTGLAAAKAVGVVQSNISRCLHYEDSTAGGYKWSYVKKVSDYE